MIGWRRRRAETTFGASAVPECSRLKADSVAKEIADAVVSADFPGFSQEHHDVLSQRTVAEYRAAAALPIDATRALSDGWALECTAKLQADCSQAEDYAKTTKTEFVTAANRLADLDKPMGIGGWCLLVIASLGGIALAAAVVGKLLGPSIDVYMFRSYYETVFDADVERYASEVARNTAMGCIALLLGVQLGICLYARNGVGWGTKLGFILADICVATGFAILRLGDGFSWQATAASIFEFGLNLVCTVGILEIAKGTQSNAKVAEPYRKARAQLKAKAKLYARASEIVNEVEARLLAQMRVIETREDGVRRAALYEALVAVSASAAYAGEISKLISNAARNPSEDALTERLEAHLGSAFAREGRR